LRDARSVIRRRRAVLVGLVVLSVLLLTAYFGEARGGVLHTLQRGAQAIFAPIEEGASRALKPVRDFTGWIGDTFEATGQNEVLQDEVARLRQQLAATHIAARDAEELRRILRLQQEKGYPLGTDPVTARVIAQSPTVWYSTVQIDKGTSAGVQKDQPVVTADGLAGKVTEATRGSATVTLITDASSAVSAQVMPKGVRGIVRPQVGDPEDLLVDFLEKDEQIREGDTVITSGSTSTQFESLFPRGIPIGRVVRVDADEQQLYQRVHIEPFADLRRIEFVNVVTGRPEEIVPTEKAPAAADSTAPGAPGVGG
jgi:rod shape-determining protein MreC